MSWADYLPHRLAMRATETIVDSANSAVRSGGNYAQDSSPEARLERAKRKAVRVVKVGAAVGGAGVLSVLAYRRWR